VARGLVEVRVQIIRQEGALGARFGESYRDSARRVHRWLGGRDESR